MSLNIKGCPKNTRFLVLKTVKVDQRYKLDVIYSYIGIIELAQLYDRDILDETSRIFPRPVTFGTSLEYSLPELHELWNEGLTVQELEDYLND